MEDGEKEYYNEYAKKTGRNRGILKHSPNGFGLGKKNPKEHRTWANMKARCNDKNNPKYKHYGARGISVCEHWDYFIDFLNDMGKKPDNLSIDRINNNKGYSKQNCRWATAKQQANNKRNSRQLFADTMSQ